MQREHDERPADEHLARQDEDREPQRRRAVDDDAADADDEQQPVGGRVEHLAELAHLVEVAGDVAVDPVGDAEHAEQHRRRQPVVPAEQQPEEHRQAQQPHDGDHVGDR